jgi:NAD(P)-dependent dehydrogenase (short-subunit alcohol dehydrogenase family)
VTLPPLAELFDLTGRVAIVTGGSRGLGLEMAEGLGEAGAAVCITARREPDLQEASVHLEAMGIRAFAFQGSVTDPEAAGQLVSSVRERFGRIDILINAAGVSWGAPTLEMPLDRWQYVLDTNLTGAWILCQEVCKTMVEQGEGGRIINIASIAGLKGESPRRLTAIGYSASKAGLIGLTRTLASHMAEHNILVNAICPGFFPTRMTRGVLAERGDQIAEASPLQRVGRPGELKGVAVFLASPASSYITGQAIAVDGGTTIW